MAGITCHVYIMVLNNDELQMLNDIAVSLNTDDYNQAINTIYQLVDYQCNNDFIADKKLQAYLDEHQ